MSLIQRVYLLSVHITSVFVIACLCVSVLVIPAFADENQPGIINNVVSVTDDGDAVKANDKIVASPVLSTAKPAVKKVTSIVYINSSSLTRPPVLCKKSITGGDEIPILTLPKNCRSCAISADGTMAIYPEKNSIALWRKNGTDKLYPVKSKKKIYRCKILDVSRDFSTALIIADTNPEIYPINNELYVLNIVAGTFRKCREENVYSAALMNGPLGYITFSREDERGDWPRMEVSNTSVDRKLVLKYSNGTIVCIDSYGKKIKTISSKGRIIRAMTFSNDGKYIIYQDDIGLWKNRVSGGKSSKICNTDKVNALKLMPVSDNSAIFYIMNDKNVHGGDYIDPETCGIISLNGRKRTAIPIEKGLRTYNCSYVPALKSIIVTGSLSERYRHSRAMLIIHGGKTDIFTYGILSYVRTITENVPLAVIANMKKPARINGLRDYFVLEEAVSADFDGDGTQEQACWASRDCGTLDAWIIKNGKVIWRISDEYRGDELKMHLFKADDCTGDKIPELILSFSNDTPVCEDYNDYVNIYKWSHGRMVNISPKKGSESVADGLWNERVDIVKNRLFIKCSNESRYSSDKNKPVTKGFKKYKWDSKKEHFEEIK